MQSTDKPAGPNFGLPEPVLSVLPTDPFEQLDVARKITSIALATRVSKLESEATRLRQKAAEKDDLIAELQAQIESLDASLSETSDQLARAVEQRVNTQPGRNPAYFLLLRFASENFLLFFFFCRRVC